MKSADAGIAVCGVEVRIDLVHEIEGEKLRAHICEARGEGAENCPMGWTSSMLLSCLSKTCGVCHDCGVKNLLPSHNAQRLKDMKSEIKLELQKAQQTKRRTIKATKLVKDSLNAASLAQEAMQLEELTTTLNLDKKSGPELVEDAEKVHALATKMRLVGTKQLLEDVTVVDELAKLLVEEGMHALGIGLAVSSQGISKLLKTGSVAGHAAEGVLHSEDDSDLDFVVLTDINDGVVDMAEGYLVSADTLEDTSNRVKVEINKLRTDGHTKVALH